MPATQQLPADFKALHHIHLIKNRAMAIWINLAGVALFLVFGVWFARASMRLRPDFWIDGQPASGGNELLSFVIAFALMLVLHEGLHGLFFWLFSRARPTFGFGWVYAYAAAPQWYFSRNQYVIIAIAPLVVITAVGLLLMRSLPLGMLPALLFLLIFNGAGSAGDLYAMVTSLFYPDDVLINDQGDEFTIYGDPALMPELPERPQ